jgi:hypothetical protein
MFSAIGMMESTSPLQLFNPPCPAKKHCRYEQGAGEGLLVTRILLYLRRYKIVWFEKVLITRTTPHDKQPTCLANAAFSHRGLSSSSVLSRPLIT